MKKNLNKISFMVFLLFAMSIQQLQAQSKILPNIIVIFMDDMGYGDLGSYGAIGYKTPHLDKMAAEGMRFTNFYSAQPICTASRAGLITGCYPNRIGLTGALFPNSKIGLNKDEETIGEVLKKKNYKTAIIGKWHLGDRKEFLPLQHGFDEYFGIPYSNDMWPLDNLGKPINADNSRAKMPPLPLIEGNETIRTINNMDDMAKITNWYTEKAVEFIDKNKKEPFFLYLPHTMTHIPLAVSNQFKGKSKQGLYGDVMMEIDWSVGEIMTALKKNNLEDNTLVIFTSDNGPWLKFGNHAGSSGGLKEGKMTSWEGGQRVSCLMKWHKVIPAGTVNNAIACTIDLLPTFAAITKAPLSKNKIDGLNILPLLKGEDVSVRNEILYYFGKNDLRAIRVGDWKLVFPHAYPTANIPGNDGLSGKTPSINTPLALYDLRRDPGEYFNVFDQYPEVVQQLQAAAAKAREDLGDNLMKIEAKNSRPPGKIND